jgi:hypothetical protein
MPSKLSETGRAGDSSEHISVMKTESLALANYESSPPIKMYSELSAVLLFNDLLVCCQGHLTK